MVNLRLTNQQMIQSNINEVHANHLIICPVEQVRKGWKKAFMEMAEKQDDVLLDDINTTEWDETEWKW